MADSTKADSTKADSDVADSRVATAVAAGPSSHLAPVAEVGEQITTQAREIKGAVTRAQTEMVEGLRALNIKAEARIAMMAVRLTHVCSCVRRIAKALADAKEEVDEGGSNANPSTPLPLLNVAATASP